MSLRLAVCFLLCSVAAAAVETPLTPRAIDEALTIGQSTLERVRGRFHAPYRVAVNRGPVDYIEVITPFRRVALAGEERARIGDRSFGQRQVRDDPSLIREELELRIELTFHPLNTYVAVPSYEVRLAGTRGAGFEPRTLDRMPRYGARVEGAPTVTPLPAGPVLPGASQPILGGTVVARFDLRALDPAASYDALIHEGGAELARARVDLARLK
jgi:hypothetical protein